jgi:hypothetical protein
MAAARRPPRAGSARAARTPTCPTAWPDAGSPRGARSGTGWWRSCTASGTTRHVHPVYTPPGGRTGRPAGAQFPGAAVYASPTARTIQAPDRGAAAGTTLERDDPDASPPDQQAHRRPPGRPDGQRPAAAPGPAGPRRPPGPARPARPRRAHAGGPGPPGVAQVVTSHHSDASGRPGPGRADVDAQRARLTQTRRAGTDQPPTSPISSRSASTPCTGTWPTSSASSASPPVPRPRPGVSAPGLV